MPISGNFVTMHLPKPIRCVPLAWLATLVCIVHGQTPLLLDNEVQRAASFPNSTVTMTGHSELRMDGTGDPLSGSTVDLNSDDAWVFFHAIKPSAAVTLLSHLRVNGAPAVLNTNVRVVEYGVGSVVIPHAANFYPMTVFEGKSFTGKSRSLSQYTAYGWQELGSFNDSIRSFILKRGYTATIASAPDGTGTSRNFVAADGDLLVGALGGDLDNAVSFVRIFPWRWVSKKGTCDSSPDGLKAGWNYNWNINSNSTLDWEYVAIKQQRWWPGLNENWKTRGVNHLLGFNEPNNPVEDAYTSLDNGSTTTAVAAWPDLLSTGLRVGAPAVTDGGFSWLTDFMNKAGNAGHRVDFVPVHYYRSYWNKTDPQGAANQLYNFLKGFHDATGLPVWVTEFNNGANWTDDAHDPSPEQNRDAIEAMINMMDNTWWIERYSVYSRVEWFRQTYYDDGSITPMGAMYRDHGSPVGYVQQVPNPWISAEARYEFDGDLRDALVNGNDGMAVGAPDFVAGKSGQAISMNGTSDYVQLTEALGDADDFTFAGWVNWNGGGNWQRILDFGRGGTDNYMFLTPKSGAGTLRFGIRLAGVEQIVETGVLPTGSWTHVAVTVGGNTAKIFVNGVLRATNTGFTHNPSGVDSKYNYLGKSQWPDPLFNGKLDDLRFVNSALSDAQIAAMAAATPPQFATSYYGESAVKSQPFTGTMAAEVTGGIGARSFSKAAGPAWLAVAPDGSLTGVPGLNDGGVNRFLIRVTDSIGGLTTTTLEVFVGDPTGLVARYAFDANTNASPGPNGNASGSPSYTSGVNGAAINLDGTDDFVTLPAGTAATEEFTISAWFLRNDDDSWQRIFDFGTGTDQYMFLSPRSAGGKIRFAIKNGAGEQALEAPLRPTGQWVHVAVTLGSDIGKLYVNGALADTRTITIKPTDFSHEINYIGKSLWPDPLFNGRIDEFLVFNEVLDAGEIAALANVSNRAPSFTVDPFTRPAAVPGQVYQQTIAGSATDPNAGSALSYSKTGGPHWLTVEPDGRISGVPAHADAGTNRFTVRVTDPTGLADEATMTVVVSAPSGLLAHYQFQGTSTDSAGNFHGTASGGPGYVNATLDQAIALNGVDDLVTLPGGMVNGLGDITLAAKFRWDGGNDWQRVFDFGNGTGSYFFLAPRGAGTMRFAIKNGGGEQILTGPPAPVGEWVHVAVTLIGNTGTLYVNGAPVDTQTITLDPSNFAPVSNYLGKSQYPADPLFKGAIDDFRIYDHGLTAADVASLAIPQPATIVPDSPYDAWAVSTQFPPGQEAPQIDADFDGIANLFEFLLGSDPLHPDGEALPHGKVLTAAQLGLAGSKHYLGMSARLRVDRTGTTVTAEAAGTLAGLALPAAAASAIRVNPAVPDGDFEIITWYYEVAIEDAPAGTGFMRLRASFP